MNNNENLECPECKTILSFSDGHAVDPQNCDDPHYGCKKCKFKIYISQEEPNDNTGNVIWKSKDMDL